MANLDPLPTPGKLVASDEDRGEVEGRKATREEIAKWRNELGSWRTPTDFAAAVQRIAYALHDYALDQPGLHFRDAWIAAECAQHSCADKVRLGADPPDFELMLRGQVLHCEALEVLAPGRRRGDELKADRLRPAAERSKPVNIPQEAWLPSEEALAQIQRQVTRKAQKGYPASTILTVYLNLGFIAGSAAFEDGIRAALENGLQAFKEVWVLNGRAELQQYVT
jgi:hypothetical protein